MRQRGKPFLGICVGLQLMAERGLEHGLTPGLGWIGGEVRAIEPSDPSLKIPHMGWNTLDARPRSTLCSRASRPATAGLNAYFVHSYHLVPSRAETLVATTDYGGPITAFVAKDNMAGSQFHPEKSQKLGLALIANFLKWNRDDGHDPVPRHRPERRAMRAAPPGRDGAGDGVQRRSGGAGARVRGAGLRLAACGRSQRRLRGQAGEREGGRGDPRRGAHLRSSSAAASATSTPSSTGSARASTA